MNDQLEELETALKSIASGEYGGTAIKLELEAQLNRPGSDDDSEGCDSCDSDGYNYCEFCNEGVVEDEDDDEGNTVVHDCEYCDGSGRVECSDCDGSGCYGSSDEYNNDICQRFILEAVSEAAKEGLVYSQFYNDGSVDSEFTFTLKIEYGKYAVEYIRAFKKLAQEIGNGLDTEGAGMHIAILNDPDGNYGYSSCNRLDEEKTDNFVSSVTPLLPALYFLGSADYRSRSLGYRKPWISSPWHKDHDKYSAINGGSNCFEFRVFETCYDRPETVFDYIIVIANCLKYYSSEYVDTSKKLGLLGFKEGKGVDRFYYTSKHLEALAHGLKLLKPEYKSVQTLKKERNFTHSLSNPKSIDKTHEARWKSEYPSIKQRQMFARQAYYHRYIGSYYEKVGAYGQDGTIERTGCATAREYAHKRLREECAGLYGGMKGYIDQQKHQLNIDADYYVEV